jgi:hypothetical protein
MGEISAETPDSKNTTSPRMCQTGSLKILLCSHLQADERRLLYAVLDPSPSMMLIPSTTIKYTQPTKMVGDVRLH